MHLCPFKVTPLVKFFRFGWYSLIEIVCGEWGEDGFEEKRFVKHKGKSKTTLYLVGERGDRRRGRITGAERVAGVAEAEHLCDG